MSACVNQFSLKPKKKYADKGEARLTAHIHNKQTNYVHKYEVYRCPKCRYWHVGRIPAFMIYRREQRRKRKREEDMVGKLIGILRGTYKGTDLITTDPDTKLTASQSRPQSAPGEQKEE